MNRVRQYMASLASNTDYVRAQLLRKRLIRELLEPHFHRHVAAEGGRVGRDVDEVGEHPRAFFQLDHRQDDGRLHLEGLVEDLVRDLERVERAAPARLDPLDVP